MTELDVKIEKLRKKFPNIPWEASGYIYIKTFKENLLHSYEDQPAIQYSPVIKNKLFGYYYEGKLHREGDLPAYINTWNGVETEAWYNYGKRHREGDKPAVTINTIIGHSKKIWYFEGLIHREGDLPALICNVYRVWYKYGKVHRENGPAVIFSDGKEEFYKEGIKITKKPRPKQIIPIEKLTDEVTEEILTIKKKRGRPKGSKNRK